MIVLKRRLKNPDLAIFESEKKNVRKCEIIVA